METPTKNNDPSLALSHYVIVRGDLSPGLQLAYAVHAAGESVSERVPAGTRAVVLASENEGALRELASNLVEAGAPHHVVIEAGELFSIGMVPTCDPPPDCLRALGLAGIRTAV